MTITLYHGSKSGLDGSIRPISRDRCDFGSGFYMGTDKLQPLTLVCSYEKPCLYTVELDLEGLSVLDLPSDLEWAFYIAFNRGKLERDLAPDLYDRIAQIDAGKDVVTGKIANDRMFVVLDRFFEGAITDTALLACLSALDIGTQYVVKTARACERIHIVETHWLDEDDRQRYAKLSKENRARGVARADAICREHRRDGRYFDEIVERWRP